MKFYSTNNPNHQVTLREAVLRGLAPDNGLYMPLQIPELPKKLFKALPELSFQEMSLLVAKNLLGDDLPESQLSTIVEHTIQFDAPLVSLGENVFSLELFHGPTLAFKDFGARFLAGLLGYFAEQQSREVTILVATSGDTGSAVANGFLNVPGTRVVVLYPKGKVSEIQEKQFTTLGSNITAVEVDGTFDDCQRMVKQAFLDKELQGKLFLTSANSINIARLMPQSFYYFYGWSRLRTNTPVVFSVPSGNFGNLTAGLFAKRMGLPIHHFVASTNINDVVPSYLQSGLFEPRSSNATMSNAMDVGNPSNFARMLDLFGHSRQRMHEEISGFGFSDEDTKQVMQQVHREFDYVMDPHGAIGYLGLKKYQRDHASTVGVFLETAHPAKFKETVDATLSASIAIPDRLADFLHREKKVVEIGNDFGELRGCLIT
ncbi:MAG: threonine synthase [Bacteroidota bacterium]|nr:threonine synthase [Cytophagales bacterium]MCE2955763.1 threonine synthase [Flammeovirgaceae bacterium]MCZ8070664.1 threonine synthase [Cytophagales bacterium]